MAGLSVLGNIHRHCGDPGRARGLHEEMLRIARALGARIWIATTLLDLGRDHLARGDLDEAARLLDEARSTAGDAMQFGVPAMIARGDVALLRHEPALALALAREARGAVDYPAFVVDARRLEAEAMAAEGEAVGAEKRLRALVHEAIALGSAAAAWQVRLALADILDRSGADGSAERAAAVAALEEAARDLPDALRTSFEASPLMRRARSGRR